MRAALSAFTLCFALMLGSALHAADRARLEAFLNVTGFDVALESIALSADSAPEMIGLAADDFGIRWSLMTREVFETGLMHEMALDILEQTLAPHLLAHAAEFYASTLGQRLVAAENASHMVEDDDAKRAEGDAIIAQLDADGASRLGLLSRLNAAAGSADHSVRAVQEIQVRFLMAAARAGVIGLRMEEGDLRAALAEGEDELRAALKASAMAGAAYTYQDFSNADVADYAAALEHPDMRAVYELMNAVQSEIMANRFEELARRMAAVGPSEEL
ncbi:MAG: DUF2059 domain-containing protein [Pseudomonadota bacterium]